jgi:hypothetical protein
MTGSYFARTAAGICAAVVIARDYRTAHAPIWGLFRGSQIIEQDEGAAFIEEGSRNRPGKPRPGLSQAETLALARPKLLNTEKPWPVTAETRYRQVGPRRTCGALSRPGILVQRYIEVEKLLGTGFDAGQV